MARHWLEPGQYREVVQIGAVKLDGRDLKALDEFDLLVRPRINPVLSPYFEQLTGIGNDEVAARGVDFAEAYERFAAFAGDGPICAFGHDEWVLEDNIRLYGLKDLPALPRFLELRQWFDGNGINTNRLHSCDVGPLLGVPFEGQMHDALCDARSIAAGMAVLLKRGAKLSF
jgi:inhibitor of KinA sporulation pathway (predicted exonuclease)